ncbi:TPA: DeoR/GlpR family DNA-binding transcription regulator [Citrobacter farmeri]|uniref:DeoR/GlpR family DNA-binding transcription regulator n=1 Tax=Enterobacterales TaxID=91347 RepID=UPI000E12F4F9|nr:MULTISPECIES: DeoR/GlpR family DNA-binding transcription regulator [Citrobacter]AYL49868.1 DNA-binding transcriptional regulator [Citrobacter freundii]MEC3933884.1 DeoR/GlpR family DNA-binding transcription regulator [Citrobacter farmeri]UBI23158.1 DeoR/GlpR family DNA-binding transcription regulator [Citrobacter amalonaticus]STA62790.1 DNA-binding transcriptional repressor GlpR [Citrobacter amalonaticus]BCU51046.1 DeoR family transcriptional regulator [Citrobacter amalonaticus]
MLNQERQDRICAHLAAKGRVIATELAKEFNVSEDAVRRDLRELARLGLCRRVYGGALAPAPDFGNIQQRTTDAPEDKQKLAKRVSAHIEEGQTIFIDASSTNIAVAAELPRSKRFTVITNAPAVAVALSDHTLCKVLVLGGIFNPIKGACLGSQTIQELKKIYVDVLILGACGVDKVLGITALDPEEAELKRCLIEQSSQIVVPVTTNKVGTAAPYKLTEASEIDVLIVEHDLDPSAISDFSEIGIQVDVAD